MGLHPSSTAYAEVSGLCAAYNASTAPYILRTDHEHHRERQRARAIRHRLARHGWQTHETEDGRLLPGRLIGRHS